MEFIKVRHADGREADITDTEVDSYRAIGFTPVDGQAVAGGQAGGRVGTASAAVQAAANGTDQRIDLLIAEIRGLRADLTGSVESVEGMELEAFAMPALDLGPLLDEIRGLRADLSPVLAQFVAEPTGEPADGETVELREPGSIAPVNLTAMNRDELNAHALSVGITDPAAVKSKPELIAAIEAARPAAE